MEVGGPWWEQQPTRVWRLPVWSIITFQLNQAVEDRVDRDLCLLPSGAGIELRLFYCT